MPAARIKPYIRKFAAFAKAQTYSKRERVKFAQYVGKPRDAVRGRGDSLALIEYTLDGKRDKVKIAIERIKSFDPLTTGFMDTPYYVAYSGGKDSDAVRILFELAGARYDLVHNHTTVDAPETVYYTRSIPKIQISYPDISMWALIVKKRMPPTRLARYCCEYLKERGGEGRFVVTGVRWKESASRAKRRGSVEAMKSGRDNNRLILNADNDEHRKQIESCITKNKFILNPIVDWTDDEVWELLHAHGCNSNPLYECGFKRVGCIGCPMAGRKGMMKGFELYPKYKAAYIRAFDKMLKKRDADGLHASGWKTAEDVFNWWISDTKREKVDPQQVSILDFEGVTF